MTSVGGTKLSRGGCFCVTSRLSRGIRVDVGIPCMHADKQRRGLRGRNEGFRGLPRLQHARRGKSAAQHCLPRCRSMLPRCAARLPGRAQHDCRGARSMPAEVRSMTAEGQHVCRVGVQQRSTARSAAWLPRACRGAACLPGVCRVCSVPSLATREMAWYRQADLALGRTSVVVKKISS